MDLHPLMLVLNIAFLLGGYGIHCAFIPSLVRLFVLLTILQISVNAQIVSDSGGTCVCNPPSDGSDPLCNLNTEYMSCVNEVRLDLITSTAGIAALSSFLLGFIANLPVGMAPGLGLNAYVCLAVTQIEGLLN